MLATIYSTSSSIHRYNLTNLNSFKFYRVRVERQGGAWCPKNQITSEAEEWLQVRARSVFKLFLLHLFRL
jgi:hypothetical protein